MRNVNWYLIGGILVCVLGALLYLMMQPDLMKKGQEAAVAGEVATSMEMDGDIDDNGGEEPIDSDDDASEAEVEELGGDMEPMEPMEPMEEEA